MASIPDYSEAQKAHRYHKYWLKLFESYFEAFPPPEPTADDATDTASENESDSEPPLDSAEEEVFAKSAAGKRKQKAEMHKSVKRAKKTAQHQALSREANIKGRFIRKRQKQLKSFMQWHCPPIPRASRKKGGSAPGMFGLPVFRHPAVHPTRLNQEDEIYISLFYPTRIIHKVREHIEKDEFKGPAVNIIRQIARQMLEVEDEETRGIVTAAMDAQRVAHAEEDKDKEGNKKDDKPTPEQYQKAIDSFPPYIDNLLQEVTKHTGFCATLIMGGPIPAHNSAISTVSYHMGNNPFGSTFGTAHRSYNSDVIGPYTDFLRTIYSLETRSVRALNAPPLVHGLMALSTEGLHTLDPPRTTPAPSIAVPHELSPSAALLDIVPSPSTSSAPWPATPNTTIHPSPRHHRIALNGPPPAADREAASLPPATQLGYKDVLKARAEAEALAASPVNTERPAVNTEELAATAEPRPRPKPRPLKKKPDTLTAPPVNAKELAATAEPRPRPKPRPLKKPDALAAPAVNTEEPAVNAPVESGVTGPVVASNPSVHQPSPPIITLPIAVVGPQGRPRRELHMTAAAEILAEEKKAKAAALTASAAKRAARAIANGSVAAKETQPKKRKSAGPKSKRSKD
ncbi:hypothetical protein FIBSPDRAFT_944527 [Athelia psychrophila]|uniref:Uncharacterized protein n=1 Tax=Athelia psychrophila TaxID=1759441 RepID=A0A166UPQ2_9AGAM|nr:hypothetical protein FIBSPDRAFT_944527 [Fibularhizoctonia sp. CBS 109695]